MLCVVPRIKCIHYLESLVSQRIVQRNRFAKKLKCFHNVPITFHQICCSFRMNSKNYILNRTPLNTIVGEEDSRYIKMWSMMHCDLIPWVTNLLLYITSFYWCPYLNSQKIRHIVIFKKNWPWETHKCSF